MSGAHRRKAAPININATLAATASPSPPPVSPVGTDLDGFVHGHKTLSLDAITCDDRAQVRVQPLDPATVDAYAEAMRGGAKFPPVTAFFDGKAHWLADGFHRVAAAREAGKREVPADIREGGLREAILHAVGANDAHGLRRTRSDAQRAVLLLLADPEWGQRSDRWIASQARVDHKTVAKIRGEMTREATGEFPQSDGAEDTQGPETPQPDTAPAKSTSRPVVRTGRDGRTINTANIGKAKPKATSKPGKAATPTRDKATPASPPPEATAGSLDLPVPRELAAQLAAAGFGSVRLVCEVPGSPDPTDKQRRAALATVRAWAEGGLVGGVGALARR